MRIISDNRRIDVPYESAVICIDDEHIVAIISGNVFKLAHPETLVEAKNALNAVTEAYQAGAKVVYMDYVMEEVKE